MISLAPWEFEPDTLQVHVGAVSLKHESSSQTLHASAKHLFFNRELYRTHRQTLDPTPCRVPALQPCGLPEWSKGHWSHSEFDWYGFNIRHPAGARGGAPDHHSRVRADRQRASTGGLVQHARYLARKSIRDGRECRDSEPPWYKVGSRFSVCTRKVDIRLPEKGDSNSHGARPVH